MDKIMNAKKLWDVCAVARGLRFYAPEMATLFFLKFTSENSEYFDVEISKLNSFNALVELGSVKSYAQICLYGLVEIYYRGAA